MVYEIHISSSLKMGTLISLYSKLGRFLRSSYDLKLQVCFKCDNFFLPKDIQEYVFYLLGQGNENHSLASDRRGDLTYFQRSAVSVLLMD